MITSFQIFRTAWPLADAIKVMGGVRDLDVYIEQPCATYEECALVIYFSYPIVRLKQDKQENCKARGSINFEMALK